MKILTKILSTVDEMNYIIIIILDLGWNAADPLRIK